MIEAADLPRGTEFPLLVILSLVVMGTAGVALVALVAHLMVLISRSIIRAIGG